MTWRDMYRSASFRGATFKVESADSAYGRRQAVHEHALRDVPYTEDLGRRAREFTVTGYLVGENYHLERDTLIEACETPGPGQLVHPYRGELTVVCRGLSVNEASQNGGMCRVSITFLEAGEASYPRAVTDSVNAISRAGNSVISAAQAGFVERFITDGFPGFVLEAAMQRLQEITDFLGAPGGINLAGELEAAASFSRALRNLADNAMSIVQQPEQLASRLIDMVDLASDAYGENAGALFVGLMEQVSASYGGLTNTPSRRQQATNHEAIDELVRQVSLPAVARAAVAIDYPSYQDANSARQTLVELIDTEMERTGNDEAYVTLGALRTEVARGIPQPEVDLPQLVEYTPPSTQPSLLVAYKLYGDAGRADEIVSRNKPHHPGFLPGGQQLEVLSDG